MNPVCAVLVSTILIGFGQSPDHPSRVEFRKLGGRLTFETRDGKPVVVTAEIKYSPLGDEFVELLKQESALRELRLGAAITDRGVAKIADYFPHLEVLLLSPSQATTTKASLKHLQKLEKLKDLTLPIKDDDANTACELAQLKSLERMAGGWQHFKKDKELACIAEMPNLKELYYREGLFELSPASIHLLPRFPALETLYFSSNNGTDYAPLSRVKTLKTVNFYGYTRPGVFSTLKDAKQIKHLKIQANSRLQDYELEFLECWPQLESFRLYSAKEITNKGMEHLRNCENLQALELFMTKVEIAGVLANLGKCKKLRELNVVDLVISDAELEKLVTMFPDLELLAFRGDKLSIAGWRSLGKLVKLKSLTVRSPTTEDEIASALPTLVHLENLDMAGTAITDKTVLAISNQCKLREVTLRDCRNITDRSLKHLSQFEGIKSLSLQNTSVSNEGLPYLRPMRKLYLLFLGGTRVDEGGMKHLEGFPDLTYLALTAAFSQESVAALRNHYTPWIFIHSKWK